MVNTLKKEETLSLVVDELTVDDNNVDDVVVCIIVTMIIVFQNHISQWCNFYTRSKLISIRTTRIVDSQIVIGNIDAAWI